MNILVVEDDAKLRQFLVRALSTEGYHCRAVAEGTAAIAAATADPPDLVLLDRMLPGMDGLEVCRLLRHRGVRAGILMLTALYEVDERVEGLRAGADDYLGKPFDLDELLARIEALGRRPPAIAAMEALTLGDLTLSADRREVRRGDRPVALTTLEFDLLRMLMASPGVVFSRERILSRVWGQTEDPMTNIVDVYIGRLRRKLTATDGPLRIETVRGIGYRMVADETPPRGPLLA